jgi:hypothetical protein
MPDPTDTFETWLLRRVAEAAEAREVSADLLTDLHAEIAEARERPPEERHALALMELRSGSAPPRTGSRNSWRPWRPSQPQHGN